VGGLEAQAAARAQLQEVEPAIRYCSYRLGGTDAADAADLAADLPSTPTSDLLGVWRSHEKTVQCSVIDFLMASLTEAMHVL
jgi:hypothetical protein